MVVVRPNQINGCFSEKYLRLQSKNIYRHIPEGDEVLLFCRHEVGVRR